MYDGVMPTQSDLRAQVTRLNLVLDEHIQLIQEAILEKDVRFAKKNIRQAREDIGVLSIQIGKICKLDLFFEMFFDVVKFSTICTT